MRILLYITGFLSILVPAYTAFEILLLPTVEAKVAKGGTPQKMFSLSMPCCTTLFSRRFDYSFVPLALLRLAEEAIHPMIL